MKKKIWKKKINDRKILLRQKIKLYLNYNNINDINTYQKK